MGRDKIGSRLGFILISAGCAIGCGNVWKFPWMVGQNGGGLFVLVYFVFLILLGIPAMTMEFALGRASQKSPVKMYQQLEKKGHKWHWHGYVAFAGNICLMSFYSVVTGWFVYYFYKFLIGDYEGLGFDSMIAAPEVNVGFLAIVIVFVFIVLSFKLQDGLEKVSKYMMLALLVLMVVLAVKSGFLDNASKGYEFYLVPRTTDFSLDMIVAAMNQAFFTLSIGIGSMAIFGSYIGKDRSLLGESVNVALLDSFVAIVAGLIIFPTCASFNLEVGAGPSLLFDTMATTFKNISGGRIWGTLFFLFMTFAAFSTMLAVCENIIACFRDLTNWSRRKSCIICGITIFVTSLTTALGFSVWKFEPFGEGTTWLDFWDFIVSSNLLPIGAMIITIFCNFKFGWGWDKFMAEANEGKGLKVKHWMRPLFGFVVPVCVIIVYIINMINFWS